jgi:cytoskeletal protein RodZ
MSTLSFLFGTALFPLEDTKVLFTSITIPSLVFQIIAMGYFVLFIVFSIALLIPSVMHFFDQLTDWISTSALYSVLAAIPLYLIWAITLTSLSQSALPIPGTIFSLPLLNIAAGWLIYVAAIILIDLIKPDWREAIWNLISGTSHKELDYSARLRETAVKPAASESEERAVSRENFLNNSYRSSGVNWAFLLTGVFAVVVSGVLGYYYWQTTNTISQRNLTIATQQAQITQLNSQIAQLNSQIAGLQTDLATEKANSTSLLQQLTTTKGQLAAANAQILSKSGELTASQSQVSTLQSQITSLNSQVTTLQSEKADLQNIVNLGASTVQASSYSVSQGTTTYSSVASFTANYAGYLAISGSSSTITGYIMVNDSFSSYPLNSHQYSFGTGTSLVVPVLPGSIVVYFGNTDAAGATATISVTYYY